MENQILQTQTKSFKTILTMVWLFAFIAIVLIVMTSGIMWTEYRNAQILAIDFTKSSAELGGIDKFKYYGYEQHDVRGVYDFYNPIEHSVTINGKEHVINDENVRRTAAEADEALGKLMTEKGYDCIYGSDFLVYTSYMDYIVAKFPIGIVMCVVLFLSALLFHIFILFTTSAMIIDGDNVLCVKGNKIKNQFKLKEITSVGLSSLNGIKIAGNGLKWSVNFVNDREEVMQLIVEKLESLRDEAKNHTSEVTVQQISSADELKKFKELLDAGIITREEFDTKKKQILGLE